MAYTMYAFGETEETKKDCVLVWESGTPACGFEHSLDGILYHRSLDVFIEWGISDYWRDYHPETNLVQKTGSGWGEMAILYGKDRKSLDKVVRIIKEENKHSCCPF